MSNMKQKIISKTNLAGLLFIVIVALGVFVRVYKFGSLPEGINQDEAYAGYEAYSLLKYGKDNIFYIHISPFLSIIL